MKGFIVFIGIVFLMVWGMKYYSKQKEQTVVFQMAGTNEAELKNVLKHYKHTAELEKYEAAEFLIYNMQWHNTQVVLPENFDACNLDSFSEPDALCYATALENIKQSSLNKPAYTGDAGYSMFMVRDCQYLTADMLIKSIDRMFELRNNDKNASLDWEDFCEYLLPYTPHVSPLLIPSRLEDLQDFSRKFLVVDELQNVADSFDAFQEKQVFQLLDRLGRLNYHPKSLGCFEFAYNAVMAFRMMGVPAALELNVGYKQFEGKHYYCSVWKNGTWHRFSPLSDRDMDEEKTYLEEKGGMNLYRYTYSPQKNTPIYMRRDEKEYIPEDFRTPCIKDVTEEVCEVMKLRLPFEAGCDNKLAYLATFNREETTGWRPVTWGTIRRGHVTFEHVIPERLYILSYYKDNGKQVFVGEPFYVTKEGEINEVKESFSIRKQVLLLRKFPYKSWLQEKAKNLERALILGCNDTTFCHADTLATLPSSLVPYFQDVIFKQPHSAYQYYRLKTKDSTKINLAEIQLLTEDKYGYSNAVPASPLPICSPLDSAYQNHELQLLPQNRIGVSQDGRVLTADQYKRFVDFQLGYPQYAVGIRFLPINADNIIKPGQTYQLYGWHHHGWQLEGIQTARFNYLLFDLCVGRLYWLRVMDEKMGGKEESPFIVDEQGKVIFVY